MRLAVLAKQPPARPERPPYPDAPTTRYRSQLVQIANESFAAVKPLIAELYRLQAVADRYLRTDRDDPEAPDDEWVTPSGHATKGMSPDDLRAVAQNRRHERTASGAIVQALPFPESIREEVAIMQRRLTIYRDNLPVEGIAGKAADQLEKWRVHVDQRILGDLGLTPVKIGTPLAVARDKWVKDNAALIVSQPREVAERCGAIVQEMLPNGARWETIAKRLEDEHGIARRRAALIARDQVSKYNADLNRMQQQACGIEFFQWRGAMDNRERPSHVALEGTVWSWENPPLIGAPGEPIQCRCSAIAVTSDQLKRQAATMTEEQLIARTAALGPTQAEGPDATPEQVQKRAASQIASEIRLANRREQVRR